MSSTYSTNLAIELIGTGDQAGTWGVTTNSNLGTLIEQAISGYVTQAVSTGTDTTITIPNGATGVARNMYIELTGTGGTNTNLIVPANKKLYFIFNNSTGAVTVKVSGQTGVSVPTGKKMVLVSNGTDIVNGLNYIADFGTNSFSVTNLTATSATITNLIATSASITTLTNNPTFGAGTANGVLYLNGSKVATSGSALTFDGTNLGIGVTPSYKLDVLGSGAAAAFRINNATAGKSAMLVQSNGATAGIIGLTGFVKGDSSTNLGFFAETGLDLRFYTNGSATEKAVIDTSGNLGLGVTPSAWVSTNGYRAMQIGGVGIYGRDAAANELYLTSNAFNSATGFKYIYTAAATQYAQLSGSHVWYTAPSGTAGNAISFTQAMTLDASGNLLVGTTTPALAATVRAVFNDPSAGGIELVANNSGGVAIVPSSGGGVEFVTFSGAIGSESYTERARITSGGNFQLTSGGQIELNVSTLSSKGAIAAFNVDSTSGGLVFKTESSSTLTERARITAGGFLKASNTGTYTSSTSDRHELRSDKNDITVLVSTTSTGASVVNVYSQFPASPNAGAYHFAGAISGSGYQFTVDADGDVKNTNGSYAAISDLKLKQDIEDSASQWDDIKAVRVRKYRFKRTPDAPLQIGVVAQELEQTSPGLVSEDADRDEENNDLGTTTKSVKYSILYMKAIKALQEAMARIEQLETDMAALKASA